MIRNITLNDARAIAIIYNHYIANTIITFEEQQLSEDEMKDRIKTHDTNLPWIIYEENAELLGYAYATPWKSRCAYRNSVESTVYLRKDKYRKGIGKKLYVELLKQLSKKGVHTVIAGIALPNQPSVVLHESLGFKKVAHFKEVGFKFGTCIDVAYWQYFYTKRIYIRRR